MAESEFKAHHSTSKRIRQSISVPFLWEEKPGTPKRDWKPSVPRTINQVVPTPVKLIASVPFEWEEKPGKPLPCFSHPLSELAPVLPEEKITKLPLPPVYSPRSGENLSSGTHGSDGDGNRKKWIYKPELEANGFETDESFRSAPSPSFLSNQLVSTIKVSEATPMQQNYLVESNRGQLQTPPSPASETDSSTSSYATGSTSLVGISFLERLFPLLTPDPGFLNKVGCSEKDSSLPPPNLMSKHLERESHGSVVIRRPPTLGELIMMSRKRSYQSRTFQMQKQNLSMELMKRSSLGCCFYGIGNIEDLHKKFKRQLQLKSM